MNQEKPKKLIILEKILKRMASAVLRKYKPKIIGITGSVGKTSTKEAVYCVLNGRFRVSESRKNYNNEIGIPLTIIGGEAGGRSVYAWLTVFFKWLSLMFFRVDYPEVLILEMGADRPGDISYLRSFISPDIAIITDVSGSHLEFFKTIEGVAKEKSQLIKDLGQESAIILNIDNPHIVKIKNQTKSSVVTYGFSPEADVRSSEPVLSYSSRKDEEEIKGLSFKLEHKGTTLPVRLNNVLARHSVYSALAAAAVGVEMGVNLVDIARSLENYSLPQSRMGLLRGNKGTLIIDDTYNASPVSVEAAISVWKEIKASRKIAVLGDMLELGSDTEKGHIEVARKFLEAGGDVFFGVGSRMKFAVCELEKKGFPKENIFHFSNSEKAGRHLEKIIQKGDLILVKGSQGARMEKVVEEIMAEPERARELVCRQTPDWKKIPVKDV